MAGHASVALENARLYEAQRREAESAKALLALSRDLAEASGSVAVAERIASGAGEILASPYTSVWLQHAGDAALERLAGHPGGAHEERILLRIPAEHLGPWLGRREPYVVDGPDYAAIAAAPEGTGGRFAIAPFTVEGRWGVVAAAVDAKPAPDDRELELLGSIARQTQLALQTAASYETLERTFVATVEALQTHSRRTTSTRRPTRAGSPTSPFGWARSSASSRTSSSASSWAHSSTTSGRSASRPGSS